MIRFQKADGNDFYTVLRQRINQYFEQRRLSRFGGSQMIFKTIVLLALLFTPYGLMLNGQVSGLATLGCWAIMGVATAGLGMAVMHDAVHGGYSSHDWVNRIVGFVVYVLIVGGNPLSWKLQHNVLHHRYTNIYGTDEDLEPYGTMRFTPKAEARRRYRWQHIYALFLYSLLSLIWVLKKEFGKLAEYYRRGLIKTKRAYLREMAILIGAKLFYFTYIMIIPMAVLHLSFWQWLPGFLLFHFISGLIISVIFQLAHVVEEASFPSPNASGDIDNQWAVHQMNTTADFSPNNRWLTWYVGGLNYQVEHHLFPTICHVHYPALAKIVRATAQEFKVPYHCNVTFAKALSSHLTLMRRLGNTLIQHG